MSQGSEAENLKTLGAPEGGEGARVSEMFVTGVDNTLHSLAPPLQRRATALLHSQQEMEALTFYRGWHS